MNFEFLELDLKGAFLIRSFYSGDNRGGFTKSFEKEAFCKAGIAFSVTETFASCSMKNVIRGLHFQRKNPQAKMVSVITGRIWDVIVDLRFDSPTFKQWRAYELSAENHLSLYVPRGFAHGFLSYEDETIVLYQCDGAYDRETDSGIKIDDREIGIEWPVDVKRAIRSERDMQLMSFSEYEKLL